MPTFFMNRSLADSKIGRHSLSLSVVMAISKRLYQIGIGT